MPPPIDILVVEDEPLLLLDIADQLRERNFSVHEAGNADEAISILEQNPAIQLIITDVDMPGSMDGLKLAAAVRNRWPPVKIIVVSGQRRVDDADLPDGSLFFSKPYETERLVISMKRLLAG